MNWLRGFGQRLLHVGKLLAFIPTFVLYCFTLPIFWLFTGKHIDPPKWFQRMWDSGGPYGY